MLSLIRSIAARQRGENGASAVEYALLVAGIAAVCVAVVVLLGGATSRAYKDSCTRVGTDPTSTATGGTSC